MAERLPFAQTEPGREVMVVGRVVKVVFANRETLFTVAVLDTEEGEITAVGPLGALAPGERLRLWGRFGHHPTYGRQIEVSRFRIEDPTTAAGIEAYLGSGLIPGLGPKTAARIVAKFGDKTLEVIREEPERLREIKGIGKKTQAKITRVVEEQREMEGLMVFLRGHGLSAGLAAKLFNRYGAAALARVREDPYLLARQVAGVGFAKADELALKLGLPETSPQRLAAGLRHVLSQAAEDGHLYLEYEDLAARTADMLAVDVGLVKLRLAELLSRRQLMAEDLNAGLDDFRPNYKAIYLPGLYWAERMVAHRVQALVRAAGPVGRRRAIELAAEAGRKMGVDLAEGQRRALVQCLTDKVTIITGGPGTGKTTLIRALVRLYQELDLSLALAAPTGRAARRLSEAAGWPASTIHRLLGYTPNAGFTHDAEHPLDFKAVVVDEASMIDIGLMANLLRALTDRTILVLVGDVDQLPPVGPGQVLADLIASERVGVVRLTEIFRQAAESRIVINAHRIRQGLMPHLEGGDDFYFIHQEDPHRAARMIVEMAARRIPERFGLDPFTEIQVLAPMRRGLTGVEGLNLELQQALNPGGEWLAGERFRVGDKVIQTRNNYDKMVFNGDVGWVAGKAKGGGVLVEMDGQLIPYQAHELDQLSLAYCLSVHKSQGSEYKAVILPLMREHWIMLGRNLVYTALTRARELAVMIGGPEMLKRAVGRSGQVRRLSLLDRRLKEGWD